MHRIMADLMSKDFEIVTRPSEENYLMHIPEGNSANEGRIGAQGSFSRIYHQFSLTLTTVNSGQIFRWMENNWFTDKVQFGAKFTIEPAELTDYAGADVVDVLNPLGAENEHSIGRFRFVRAALVDGGNYHKIHHPKVIPLKRANNVDSSYDYVAMAVWTETYGTTNAFWFSLMRNKRRDASTPDVTWPYIWGEPFSSTAVCPVTLSPLTDTSDLYKVCDLVEFDDGSIFMVVATHVHAIDTSLVFCFRSFDYGVTWVFCGFNFHSVHAYEHAIALERINERLVYIYQACVDDGVNTDIKTYTAYCDDFGFTWNLGDTMDDSTVLAVRSGVKPCVDLAYGRDGILYSGHLHYNDALADVLVYFSQTMDGDNWVGDASMGGNDPESYGFALVENSTGGWVLYNRKSDTGDANDFELDVWVNPYTPTTDYWNSGSAFNSMTYNSVTAAVSYDDVCACSVNNQSFLNVLFTMFDSVTNSAFKSTLSELKCSMWSGITPKTMNPTGSIYSTWDYVWFANCYPSTTDSEPNIHAWTKSMAGTGNATLTNDTANNRSYLRLGRTAGAGNRSMYYVACVDKKSEGGEMRISLRSLGGAYVGIRTSEGVGDGIDFDIVFDWWTDTVKIYDNYKAGGAGVVATGTTTNWTVSAWNVYHIVWKDAKVYVYRATDQFAELLNFELVVSCETLGIGAIPATEAVYFGNYPITGFDNTSNADFEYVFLNTVGIQWTTLPIDQDADLMGRRAYFYPTGLWGGMGLKFDGHYAIDGDSWDIETGAIYEVENIFVPSPTVCWKSAKNVSDPGGTEPNEIIVWKQKDSGGQMHQTAEAFAVFGRNWPFCLLEGSEDGAAFTTLFDSLTTPSLAYVLHLEANGASHYNQVKASLPAGMPALHVNRFASTPEVRYYLMAIEGDEKYRVYRILENDYDTFYLDEQLAVGIDNGEDFYIFSDRFYYDFSIQNSYPHADGDIFGSTAYNKTQYRYFRMTIYGNSGGTNVIFPTEDDGLKKLGSVHLGRIYDLPNEEWELTVSHQPMMAVTESRSGRKEYRRIGKARRVVGLSYTGMIERGLGVNPVVDLNRALGWGEHPLVLLDDADVLRYGDSAPGYGNYTHPNPILCRMVDGYQMSRAAYSCETENNGGESMQLVRNVVDVRGIKLEEVV